MLELLVRLAPSLLLLVVGIRIRLILQAFARASATSPDRAVTLRSLRIRMGGLPLRLLERRGVLVRTADGYYLDVPARDRWRRRRRIVLATVLGLLTLLLAAILLRHR